MRNFAHLKEDSPFFDLFPNGMAPIVNILVPNQAELEGSPEREVYMLDVQKLTPEQFHGVANRLAKLFEEEPWTIRREMLLRGIPIRSSQVRAVSSDVPCFL
jgi:hypothetical protein